MKRIFFFCFAATMLAHACSNTEGQAAREAAAALAIEPPLSFDQLPVTHAAFTVKANMEYVNVMGNQRKAVPAFPAISTKKGWAIGYVKDSYGKPVAGAVIGVRSSAIGGFRSGASAVTNAKGYYEVLIPWGAADFYAGALMLDYEGAPASMSLFPADSTLGSFPGPEGIVKNWVLLPYGRCRPERVASQPHMSSNYFGGCVSIEFTSFEKGDIFAPPGALELNTEIEIKLVPEELFHASEKRSFTIRKVIGGSYMKIMNIPVGRYKIEVRKLPGGEPLKLVSEFYNPRPEYGMQPTTAEGSATVTFIPKTADAGTTKPYYGNWESVRILVKQ